MRLSGILLISLILFGLSACVLEHSPVSPNMAFKAGAAYTPAGDTLDTLSPVLIGFTARSTGSNLVYLQVAKAVDTLKPSVLNAYVLIDTESTSVSRDFSFTSGDYLSTTTETYTFKVSDAAGFTFQRSISFTIHPH